jgi:hypothetical protein
VVDLADAVPAFRHLALRIRPDAAEPNNHQPPHKIDPRRPAVRTRSFYIMRLRPLLTSTLLLVGLTSAPVAGSTSAVSADLAQAALTGSMSIPDSTCDAVSLNFNYGRLGGQCGIDDVRGITVQYPYTEQSVNYIRIDVTHDSGYAYGRRDYIYLDTDQSTASPEYFVTSDRKLATVSSWTQYGVSKSCGDLQASGGGSTRVILLQPSCVGNPRSIRVSVYTENRFHENLSKTYDYAPGTKQWSRVLTRG